MVLRQADTVDKSAKIYVAGHRGLFGSAILRRLEKLGQDNIITRSRAELDLSDARQTRNFFLSEKPEYVFCMAAKVGGIQTNNAHMADFAMANLKITINLIDSAYKTGVKKLLYPGAPCIYPRECPQPIKEECLLTGPFEPTNEGYAIAKIAGVRLCDYYKKQYAVDFISCMPVNLYGPGDCFDDSKNHVIPALLQRFHLAKVKDKPTIEIWGTGEARREFMYIDDVAEAAVFLMDKYDGPGTINIGSGKDISIGELAVLIREITGYMGEITYDRSKPDGMPKRIYDSSKIQNMGFKPKTPLKEGLEKAYLWYLNNIAEKE
jgi:GDP-L-fucose synthase